MSLEDDINLLRGNPFFSGLGAEQLRLLAFSAENRSLPEHMLLYEEGHALHSSYVVTSGKLVGIRKAHARADGNDKEETSREIHRGDVLADRAMIVEIRAQESVRVIEAATALQIRRPVFHRFLSEYPDVAASIRDRMAANLQRANAEYKHATRRLNAIEI